MKKIYFAFLLCFAVSIILAVCTSCGGGGGGGGGFYSSDDGPHNGGGGGSWGGANSSNNSTSTGSNGNNSNAIIVLTGGTSLDVEYYTYKGQNYYSAQALLDVLGNENITGTVDIPLHAADGSSRTAKYVVTERGRTLKHPYQIALNDSNGNPLYPNDASGTVEYFYASDGFPMSKITTTTVSKTVDGSPTSFPISAWNINGATIAPDGTLIGFGEGTTIEAAPVTSNFMVDSSGALSIADDYIAECAAAGTPVKIPASVGTISSIANTNLSSVTLDLSDAQVSATELDANFYYAMQMSSAQEVILPRNITTIPANGFSGFTGLTLNIPEGITTIGASAFESLTNLQTVTLPSTLTTIGDSAFTNCSGLTSINLPSSVTTINDSAFLGCSQLSSIDLSNVTTIGENAFKNSGVTSVTINANANVGNNAFHSCANLSTLTFAKDASNCSHADFGSYVFQGCSSLAAVTFPQGVKLGNGQFSGVQLATISFEGEPARWAEQLFTENYTISSIIFPDGNYYIPCGTISGSNSINSIYVGDGVYEIATSAFAGSNHINFISLPASIRTISTYAFDSSNNINVQYRGTKAQWDSSAVNVDSTTNGRLIVTTTDGITFTVN